MRLNLHDFSGHPFQVQLSRELAARGHEVLHNYSSQYLTGHGRMTVGPDDAASLSIEGITCDCNLVKYSPVGRTRFELQYAEQWRRNLEITRPDLVVACNVPLMSLARMQRYFAVRRQPWVLWHQDLYSLGMGAEADRTLPPAMAAVARRGFERLERRQVGNASAVVAITDAMVEQYHRWGIDRGPDVTVIPNWAPLGDIVPGPRDNAWSAERLLPSEPLRLLYAGTLGRKHNPLLLLELLDSLQARGIDAMLTVASEGGGALDLAEAAADRADVRLVGYQPAERFSEMLASADAVVALLEPDAAQFSVPSKVLSYLSAGRPVIGLMPEGNPAAQDVALSGGFVGAPSVAGCHAAASWLADTLRDPNGLVLIGKQARALAEERFDIHRIGDRFEEIFDRVLSSRNGRPRSVGCAEDQAHLVA